MIDEKELIKELDVWWGTLDPRSDSTICDVIEAVKEKIDDAEKIGEWIPAGERLPDVDIEVLVSCKARTTKYLYIDVDYRSKKNGKWAYFGEDVIAWMPLPELYKEEI